MVPPDRTAGLTMRVVMLREAPMPPVTAGSLQFRFCKLNARIDAIIEVNVA